MDNYIKANFWARMFASLFGKNKVFIYKPSLLINRHSVIELRTYRGKEYAVDEVHYKC